MGERERMLKGLHKINRSCFIFMVAPQVEKVRSKSKSAKCQIRIIIIQIKLINDISMTRMWDNVFKNGASKICGRQPLRNLNGYGLLNAYI